MWSLVFQLRQGEAVFSGMGKWGEGKLACMDRSPNLWSLIGFTQMRTPNPHSLVQKTLF